mgnify:CR=1 FL=1
MKISLPISRIIDANFNRSREALRVCEDIARFFLEDSSATKKLKSLRHGISDILKKCPDFSKNLIFSRESRYDIGKKTTFSEVKRKNVSDIFYANMERAKESLRVLEELSKIENASMSRSFKKLRFRVYTLEKEINAKL